MNLDMRRLAKRDAGELIFRLSLPRHLLLPFPRRWPIQAAAMLAANASGARTASTKARSPLRRDRRVKTETKGNCHVGQRRHDEKGHHRVTRNPD